MSVEAQAIAINHSRAKGNARMVLFGIAMHDGDGGAWPSIRSLARYANVDERTVQRALLELQRLGEIFVHRQAGGTTQTPDHRRPNLYQFLLTCPEDCDRSKQHKSRQQVLWDNRDPVLFDPLAPASSGDTAVTPTGDTAATPTGDTAVTRTTQEKDPLKTLGSPGLSTDVVAREAAPVDNPAIRPASWCRCNNGWLEPSLTDPDTPRPCLRCRPHLAKTRRTKLGVTR